MNAAPGPADLRRHGPHTLELKARAPIGGARRHRIELTVYLPAHLEVDEGRLSRSRVLEGVVSHVRFQVQREGLDLLDSDDPANPLVRLADENRPERISYETRMFANLFHSALRDELRSVVRAARAGTPRPALDFVARVRAVVARFERLAGGRDGAAWRDVAEYTLTRTIRRLASALLGDDLRGQSPEAAAALTTLLGELESRAEAQGMRVLVADHQLVTRDAELKKWVQSLLYLEVIESRTGEHLFQIFAAIAAGIAMAVAVTATIFAEQRWSGGSLPWAIALIGAYVVKDRLKEGVRTVLAQLIPGVVRDRVSLIREDGRVVARMVRLLRTARVGARWAAVIIEERLTIRRRLKSRHTRVDALVDIVRVDATPWLQRLDRPWKSWPVRDGDGTLRLEELPRRYRLYAAVDAPGQPTGWYRLEVDHDAIRALDPLAERPAELSDQSLTR